MARFTARDKVIGNSILTLLFTLAAVSIGMEAWAFLQTEGLSLRSVLWLLALLGFVSLTARSLRATLAAKNDPPPA